MRWAGWGAGLVVILTIGAWLLHEPGGWLMLLPWMAGIVASWNDPSRLRRCEREKSLPVDKIDNLINFVTMSRLTIEIEPDQHRQIKTMATFAGMTIKEFILAKTLGESLDEGIDTTAELLAAPENAKRLREAIAEPASTRRVFESMEELKNALGI